MPISSVATNRPDIDDFGILRLGRHWVALSELDEAIMRLLVRSLGSAVGRQDVLTAAWPDGTRSARVLDTHMHRLRNRIAPLGLTIYTVRRRGFMLDLTPSTLEHSDS